LDVTEFLDGPDLFTERFDIGQQSSLIRRFHRLPPPVFPDGIMHSVYSRVPLSAASPIAPCRCFQGRRCPRQFADISGLLVTLAIDRLSGRASIESRPTAHG